MIKNKNHQQGFSNIQIEESARQQTPVQNEDDTEQLTKINNDMGILKLLGRQRSANKVEDKSERYAVIMNIMRLIT